MNCFAARRGISAFITERILCQLSERKNQIKCSKGEYFAKVFLCCPKVKNVLATLSILVTLLTLCTLLLRSRGNIRCTKY